MIEIRDKYDNIIAVVAEDALPLKFTLKPVLGFIKNYVLHLVGKGTKLILNGMNK